MLASIQPASVNQNRDDLGIPDDSEKRENALAEFILESVATMTAEQISDAAVEKFVLPSPSRSSIYRFIEKMKGR